jgi:predicted  nucleic acid-binding Zn-ribbon protein
MQVVQITKRVAKPAVEIVTPAELEAAKAEAAAAAKAAKDAAAAADEKAGTALAAITQNSVSDAQREVLRQQFDTLLSEEDGKIRKDISNLVDKDALVDTKLTELKAAVDTKVEISDYNANAEKIEYNFLQLMGAPVGE